ncbi:DUF881 domain-containing protein [Tessaracoccus antarcticus]|uniref:DUF881 domain-containing protein n=1 Tax=Tessaracoccus antarcticus TaxID=2479848 RepID=A0A3M0G5E7_9ACTN|nr:DUF881 domain-containing protein [Tessaracoccus antarcticus]RMB60105.1 DUF881 domain-containing protein [Tessaracoccus antarcticus]
MRRPDQSMSLLTDLQANALEPEYRTSGSRRRRVSPLILGVTLAMIAALAVIAFVSTTRASGEADGERRDLLQRIGETQARVDTLEEEAAQLEADIREMGDAQLDDPALSRAQNLLEPVTGTVPVTGPGIVVEVNDASDRENGEGVVFDSDLSRLVNGLNQAGAEAVAINGRRITSLTPIRTAGSAITVDYVSLSPPYRIEAIGNPATMPARFARTGASAWWKYISDNYGVSFTIVEADGELTLPADPGMILRYAQK